MICGGILAARRAVSTSPGNANNASACSATDAASAYCRTRLSVTKLAAFAYFRFHGEVTTKVLLVPRRVYPPLENSCSSYVPGASVAGIAKDTLPLAVPVV